MWSHIKNIFAPPETKSSQTARLIALESGGPALWDRVSKAEFLSINEKRIATGYGPVEGGDVFQSSQ
jgi:hypothetical protein